MRNSDEEDEEAELMRELEKIKRERAAQREKEVGGNAIAGDEGGD
jgi:Cwf15/Cwc15 cell cycle control protein